MKIKKFNSSKEKSSIEDILDIKYCTHLVIIKLCCKTQLIQDIGLREKYRVSDLIKKLKLKNILQKNLNI